MLARADLPLTSRPSRPSRRPQVRDVVNAALALLGGSGWALDPADQVTEPAKPDADDDGPPGPGGGGSGPGSGPGSAATSRPTTAAPSGSGGALGVQASGGSGSGPTGERRCHVWNVLWSWSVRCRVPTSELLVWQRVNHFSEARQLTRKDLLKKHLAKYQARRR